MTQAQCCYDKDGVAIYDGDIILYNSMAYLVIFTFPRNNALSVRKGRTGRGAIDRLDASQCVKESS